MRACRGLKWRLKSRQRMAKTACVIPNQSPRGDLAGAKATFERALAIDEATYGPTHPDVAIDVSNLGMVLRDLGDPAGAKAAFERALRIRRQFFGEDHPSTIAVRNNLEHLERLERG